jgi:hypothetical protein
MEDFELCEKAQSNLEKGIYHEGILNPVKENGVACEIYTTQSLLYTLTVSFSLSTGSAEEGFTPIRRRETESGER